MEQGWTERDLQQLTEALRTVLEDVSAVELPPESAGQWQDDAMQVSFEQGGAHIWMA